MDVKQALRALADGVQQLSTWLGDLDTKEWMRRTVGAKGVADAQLLTNRVQIIDKLRNTVSAALDDNKVQRHTCPDDAKAELSRLINATLSITDATQDFDESFKKVLGNAAIYSLWGTIARLRPDDKPTKEYDGARALHLVKGLVIVMNKALSVVTGDDFKAPSTGAKALKKARSVLDQQHALLIQNFFTEIQSEFGKCMRETVTLPAGGTQSLTELEDLHRVLTSRVKGHPDLTGRRLERVLQFVPSVVTRGKQPTPEVMTPNALLAFCALRDALAAALKGVCNLPPKGKPRWKEAQHDLDEWASRNISKHYNAIADTCSNLLQGDHVYVPEGGPQVLESLKSLHGALSASAGRLLPKLSNVLPFVRRTWHMTPVEASPPGKRPRNDANTSASSPDTSKQTAAFYRACTLLGVTPPCSKKEVDSAYRHQAFAIHPDRKDASEQPYATHNSGVTNSSVTNSGVSNSGVSNFSVFVLTIAHSHSGIIFNPYLKQRPART